MNDERVSDQLDRASQLEEAERASCALYRKPVRTRTGRCYSCQAAVQATELFCDVDCADDYRVVEGAKARNGRKR